MYTQGCTCGFRPVVCLKSGIQLEELDNGNYKIVESETVNSSDIANNPRSYYGKIVENYDVTYDDTKGATNAWRIFYADSDNIYLITDDYVHYDYAPYKTTTNNKIYKNSDYRLSFNDVYNDYTGSESIDSSLASKWLSSYWKNNSTSTKETIRAVAYMLDTSIWNTTFKNGYAEYAIGGPTIEMFCASYKDTHPNKYIMCEAESNTNGYNVKWSSDSSYSIYVSGLATSNDYDDIYIKSDTSKAYGMWLTSTSSQPGNIMLADPYGYVDIGGKEDNERGLRPVVCLNSEVQLEKLDNGNYKIVK